ncbi:MAG: DUF4214 domain-containing protein [Pigmentiphaga sp.]|nr:DUF4214 domain-containing protein [Pigmentiphaga sp.]
MTIQYTELAQPLLQYLRHDKLSLIPSSAGLNLALHLGADYYGADPRIITANYGFEGYMGVPGLDGIDAASREAAFAANIAWQELDPALDAAARAYYSAVGYDNFLALYGVAALQGDTIPVVFSHPVLGNTVDPAAFRITLNTGETVTPLTASFLPNTEYNERQTVVLTGYWGNRLGTDDADAVYPVYVDIVATDTPLTLLTADGLVPAVGLGIESQNPYMEGNGPRLVGANLDRISDLGEGAPFWLLSSNQNSGIDLFGDEAAFRLRLYTSAGFSPDGIASILPDEFGRYFALEAIDAHGRTVWIRDAEVDVEIAGLGVVRVLGIADTGPAQDDYDLAYVEDHDNQYDIILAGDAEAIAAIQRVHLPSEGDYSPVYNPGGPGNDPAGNPDAPFTVPSSPHSVEVAHLTGQDPYVSYVEIDGPVYRDPETGQPVGAYRGLAVRDTQTGHEIHQYVDPDGKVFYASFAVGADYAIDFAAGQTHAESRVTDDRIQGNDDINWVIYHGGRDAYALEGEDDVLVVEDRQPWRDGTDHLHGIERLSFTDGAIALDLDGNAGLAWRLYGALGREADEAGLGYWIAQLDAGAGARAVAAGFVGSAEFLEGIGLPSINPGEAGAWVDALYLRFFNREADAGGRDYWTTALVDQQLDAADVVAGFAASAESIELMGAVGHWVAFEAWS